MKSWEHFFLSFIWEASFNSPISQLLDSSERMEIAEYIEYYFE